MQLTPENKENKLVQEIEDICGELAMIKQDQAIPEIALKNKAYIDARNLKVFSAFPTQRDCEMAMEVIENIIRDSKNNKIEISIENLRDFQADIKRVIDYFEHKKAQIQDFEDDLKLAQDKSERLADKSIGELYLRAEERMKIIKTQRSNRVRISHLTRALNIIEEKDLRKKVRNFQNESPEIPEDLQNMLRINEEEKIIAEHLPNAIIALHNWLMLAKRINMLQAARKPHVIRKMTEFEGKQVINCMRDFERNSSFKYRPTTLLPFTLADAGDKYLDTDALNALYYELNEMCLFISKAARQTPKAYDFDCLNNIYVTLANIYSEIVEPVERKKEDEKFQQLMQDLETQKADQKNNLRIAAYICDAAAANHARLEKMLVHQSPKYSTMRSDLFDGKKLGEMCPDNSDLPELILAIEVIQNILNKSPGNNKYAHLKSYSSSTTIKEFLKAINRISQDEKIESEI